MEQNQQLNRIEIIGIVGSKRTTEVSGQKLTHMSVATSCIYYTATDTTPVIETTWHTVEAWHKDGMPELSTLDRGSKVHVIGRIKQQRYTDADGVDRTTYSIVASSVEIIEPETKLNPEFNN